MTTAQQNENEPERRLRISIPNIPADGVRWYLSVFNLLTVYLTVTNTLFAAARDGATSWQAIQYIATGELLKAGGVALIVSPTIAEGIRMVLAGIWSERRERKARAEGVERGREEGREQGREEGKNIQQGRWEDWWQRYQNAQAAGIPFDEPPPQSDRQTEPPR